MTATPYHDRMRAKLQAAFQPQVLEITDESARHAGHSGHNPAGETHFKIVIVSDTFTGQTKISRHRQIYEILTSELQERVHALSIASYNPAEYNLK